MDQREQVASHATQVRADDRHDGVGRDRGVDRVATRPQNADAGVGGELISGGDRTIDTADRAGGRRWHGRTICNDRIVSTNRRAGAITVSTGAAITLAGTFLTWVRSGARTRSSYDVFDLVDRLGFSSGGIVGWALRLWPLVPLLLVACVVAWWWPASATWLTVVRVAAAIAVALYAGCTAIAVANAPEVGLLTIGRGPIVTAAGAAVMLAGAVVEVVSATRGGRAGRPSGLADDRS
jgi:hypothetical protein